MPDPDTPSEPEDPRDRALDYEVLEEDSGMRLDHFLNDRMVWRSRSSIQKLISKGKVWVRDSEHTLPEESQPAKKASRRVKLGEIYSANIPVPLRETESLAAIPDLEIPILYEDEWILVVDKPAGIPVHPGGRLLDRTLITLLNERYNQRVSSRGVSASKADGGSAKASKPPSPAASKPASPTSPLKLCHRLDLETSGVLLLSKDAISMPLYMRQFEDRKVIKEYLALVHGEVKEDRGEIDLPIGMAKGSKVHLKRAINHYDGQSARTGFRVEQRFAGFTLVRLRLYTGRHHQIRVHLSAMGHPIVGDKTYGVDEGLFLLYHEGRLDDEARAKLILSRQALHAARLTLHHAKCKKDMTFEAPLPGEITAFMATLAGR